VSWTGGVGAAVGVAVLLTYGHSTTCVTDAVDTYLLTGQPPTNGTTCSAPAPAVSGPTAGSPMGGHARFGRRPCGAVQEDQAHGSAMWRALPPKSTYRAPHETMSTARQARPSD
jgi:hypothetical protein